MAENLRKSYPNQSDLNEARRSEVVKEALRQAESCLYTSTSLFEWLRWVRRYRQIFVAAPILLGGLAGLGIWKKFEYDWVIALLAFAASLFPALADALNIQTSVDEITRLAAEYKALQDRFRRLANIIAPFGEADEADKLLGELMDRMDVARSTSLTPPDWAFTLAQSKIVKGHYDFTVDVSGQPKASGPD